MVGFEPGAHLNKLAMIVEYDGSRYHGFQLQPQSPTIQEALEEGIRLFTGEDRRVLCASRTDAGVHALAQVVSFHTKAGYPPQTFVRALNHFLPVDVAVQAAYHIPARYNIRARAISRQYRYVILNRSTPSPLLRHRAYWVRQELDIDRMNEAASLLLGKRDFAPFCSTMLRKGISTVRHLMQAEFRRAEKDLLVFEVKGNSFLPQQVRRMAGAVLQVGHKRKSIEEFQVLANSSILGTAGPTLQPQGLYLTAVNYKDFPPPRAAQDNKIAGLADEPSNEDVYSQSR